MLETTAWKDVDEPLDILGQQGLLKIYTQICFCYALPNEASHSTIINTLSTGLARLTENFPWVAGQVVNEGASEGNTGIFKIKPLERTPRLVVNDLRDDSAAPSMHELKQAGFPFSMLDESVIAPCNTIPGTSGEPLSDISPVLLLQANFIAGGLILTINAHHGTMDMAGQAQVIDLLCKACRGQPFLADELSSGNLHRQDLIPYLDESDDPIPEISHQLLQPKPSKPAPSGPDSVPAPPPSPPPKSTWTYFNFSQASLTALKFLAIETLPPSSEFISTDDALTAFIWQSVLRARASRLSPSQEVRLTRAVDVRRFFNIPSTYPGLMQNLTYHARPINDLTTLPLGEIAAQLRAAVSPKTSALARSTRALATYLARSANKNSVSFTATIDLTADIMLSSWAKFDCYDRDFGLGLGKPEAVRRPQFIPVESLAYLLPKSRQGDIALGICLRDEDLDRLRADQEWCRFAVSIP